MSNMFDKRYKTNENFDIWMKAVKKIAYLFRVHTNRRNFDNQNEVKFFE